MNQPNDQRADALAKGAGLVFLLGAFRGGTTLCRKLLDSHTAITAPAETWFLLPLLSMWNDKGDAEGFNRAQASAALRGHLNQEQFIACARAFAGRFYAERIADARWFVDKTPLYLQFASALPVVFPEARYIVLARDPRALCWSRHTWRHTQSPTPESRFPGVVADIARLARFIQDHADRSHLVRYENLCTEPEPTTRALCEFLELEHEPAMIDYGGFTHDEGYGDENTRAHPRPHTDSVDRWRDGLSVRQQQTLLEQCADHLAALDMGDLAPIDIAPDERAA